MNLKLVDEKAAVLRTPAQSWDFDLDGSPLDLVKEMTKLMFLHGGIGLAAPQVGVSKRIFIMGNSTKLVTCINPEIISGVGELKEQEGCLSFPDLWLSVKRYEDIVVRYLTSSNELVEENLTGLMARVFQHELEHLGGVCFDTKVSNFVLNRAKEKRKKKSRGA